MIGFAPVPPIDHAFVRHKHEEHFPFPRRPPLPGSAVISMVGGRNITKPVIFIKILADPCDDPTIQPGDCEGNVERRFAALCLGDGVSAVMRMAGNAENPAMLRGAKGGNELKVGEGEFVHAHERRDARRDVTIFSEGL
jgi:hypothetical protein